MKHFALVGNPNCGKTTLFNALTGSTAHVGNWPGVTVDKREGLYKKLSEEAYVVDLPGIYSLSPYTSEEVISRNYILNEHPDCVINIVDATNLERNLYLTTQVLEMDVPVVIALNLMDVLEAQGEEIDTKLLSERIGVPVVLISAVNGKGIDELMNVAYLASQNKRLGTSVLSDSAIGHLVKDVNTAFKGLEVEHPLFHTLKLIENDELEVADHPQLVKVVDEFKLQFNDDIFGTDLEAVVADARYKYITKNFSPTKKSLRVNNTNTLSKSDKVDRVLTNKYLGIPIFILILFVMFHLTFSENFLFLGGIFKSKGVEPFAKGSVFEGLFWTQNGINSPGVILQSFVESVAGWFTDVVKGWLVNSPSWLSGFITDGCLSGVFSVLSFLPQILLLFAFFSILEDSGYMARVAFILDRIFRKFGLSGRSFMPMIMGFGCSVPAMINTRTLSDENERVATIRVIPFFSCGAKLPILTAIAGAVVSMFGIGNADLISLGMYLIGMVTAVIAVLLMRNTVMRGKVSPFIMELPQYHRPGLKPLWLHVWDKGKHFVKKAFTIILASTIIIWFLQSFTFGWQYIEQVDLQGILNDVAATDAWKDLVVLTDDNALIDEATGFIKGLDETQNAIFFDECLASYQEIISTPGYLSSADSILAGF
jgi:ferrous iron transport protein B